MRPLTICILFIYLIHHNGAEDASTYTTKYDGINLDEILASERLLNGYVSCLLELGACTPDGKELKRNLPDAIGSDCMKCTDRQREGADQVMHYIIDHRPDDWQKLEEKYNSDGSYKRKYYEHKETTDGTTTPKEEEIKSNEVPKEKDNKT